MTDRFNQPAAGTENWDGPLNVNFADLGVEVADEVASWADLPAPSGEQSSSGNPKVYRVAADDVFVADAGTSWSIIGGLGSADNPLPPSHHESIHAEEAAIGGEQFVPERRETEANVHAEDVEYGANHGVLRQRGEVQMGMNIIQTDSQYSTTSGTYSTQVGGRQHAPFYHGTGDYPILTITGKIWNDTAGETTYLRFAYAEGYGKNGTPPSMEIAMSPETNNGKRWFCKEIPLADPFQNTNSGRKKNLPEWSLDLKTTNASGGYIGAGFRADILYEVR